MIKMMRGLVQINGQGQQAAELILNADLDPKLCTMPFASQWDYARVVDNVLTVWNLKDPTEADEWLQKSTLDPQFLKSDWSPESIFYARLRKAQQS
jgi:hypothetical protein